MGASVKPPEPLPPICDWCLSTPPRHDRCHRIYRHRAVVGTRLDSVGATVPVYEGPLYVDCECECRRQGGLW